ncbi:MAG: hypothetical protein WA093_01660 [Minisyncoccales bacterium]
MDGKVFGKKYPQAHAGGRRAVVQAPNGRRGKVSLLLTIPRGLVLELGWRDNQKVVVKKRGQGILAEDWEYSSEN